ncbi:MAG: hypothetical protein ABR968_12955 [Bacteroidales bacterium]|jgi:hypothetical protein
MIYKLKNIAIVLFFSLLTSLMYAQGKRDTITDPTGYLSLGARNCFSSFFSQGRAFIGTGAGGEFAVRIAKDFNCHWFTDWVVSNVDNLAQRDDLHGGFSMMPQVLSPRIGNRHLAMFPLVGICLDYSKFLITTGKNISSGPNFVERYSWAVQCGLGATLPVSSRLDFSLEMQYMLHMGTCVGINLYGNEVQLLKMKPAGNVCLEGHYIISLSMDFKLFKLWVKRSS